MAAPKGEPFDQLAEAVKYLRVYYVAHETFTDQRLPLTPALACCQFASLRCPPETAPDPLFTEVLRLDPSTERRFQYRYESTADKAVIEAVGDLDCDGVAVTYRREVERRADGHMHVTVIDPPAGTD